MRMPWSRRKDTTTLSFCKRFTNTFCSRCQAFCLSFFPICSVRLLVSVIWLCGKQGSKTGHKEWIHVTAFVLLSFSSSVFFPVFRVSETGPQNVDMLAAA
ncbi:hypothetical protein V8F33_000901 [Rhypophila sp. PSN 637]